MTVDQNIKEKVLDLLMEDSRLSQREIASSMGISPTTAGKILKGLEDDGIILAHTIMVDWHKLGYDSVMCLQLAILPGADVEKVGKTLKTIPGIKQVFYTMGDMTFSCYAVCKDNPEAADVMNQIGKIDGVEKLICHTVLKQF